MRRLLLAITFALPLALSAGAQESFSTGQNIAPAYEGWEKNADGSFNLVFGYFNRNWEEEIYVPAGSANTIVPGGPDRGQPTQAEPFQVVPAGQETEGRTLIAWASSAGKSTAPKTPHTMEAHTAMRRGLLRTALTRSP